MDFSSMYFTLPNIGIMAVELTTEQLHPIRQEINKIMIDWNSATSRSKTLAGQIEHEYTLTDSYNQLEAIVKESVGRYRNEGDYVQQINVMSDSKPLYLDSPWVNFQRKGEYNPPHTHGGVLSYVIWIRIPYLSKDEESAGPGYNSAQSLAGKFSFTYTDILGKINHYHIDADQSKEGTMLMFPSNLTHSVHPFYTSDEYRISVAGNIKFKV